MKFLLIVGVLVTYLVCTASLSRLISSIGRSRDVVDYRITYINKTLNIAMSLVFLIVVFLVLGIVAGISVTIYEVYHMLIPLIKSDDEV